MPKDDIINKDNNKNNSSNAIHSPIVRLLQHRSFLETWLSLKCKIADRDKAQNPFSIISDISSLKDHSLAIGMHMKLLHSSQFSAYDLNNKRNDFHSSIFLKIS